LFLAFFAPVYATLSPNASWYGLGRVGCKLVLMIMPILYIMGAMVIGRFRGKSFSLATFTYLYAAGTGLVGVASTDSYPLGNFQEVLYDSVYLAKEVNPWPSIMVPAGSVVEPLVNGGALVPWGTWMPTLFWWGLLYAGLALIALGQGTIWRRRWIDIEKVPFPQTRVATELVDKATGTGLFRVRYDMPFLIGSLLGVAYQLPLLLSYMFPWFPDIYGWRTNTCTMGAQWITPDSPLAGIVGLAQFNKNPAFGAIFYMAPLNVLFGAWFWYLVFAVLMQVAFTMGYYTGILGESGCGRVWCGTTGYRVGEPFKWNAFSSAGVSTGIFIGYVILNWKYLAETINAALGRLGKDRLAEYDRTEPTSYRNSWGLFLLGAVLVIAAFMATEVGLPAAILLVVTNVIVSFVCTRSYSLVGFIVPAGSNFYEGPMKMLLGGGTQYGNTQWYVSMGMTYALACEPTTGGGTSVPFITSLGSYQMASVNKVSVKNVLKIQLFVCVIAAFISIAGAVWGFYTFGITKMPSSVGSFYSWYEGYTPDQVANRPTYEPWLPHMVAGAAFAMLLSFLHSRFVWFPLEPLGFLLATDGHALIEGIWTMTLAAWVAKIITLRIGGSKLYEKTGTPVAIGFIIGVVLIVILGGAVLVLRYFFPF